MKSVKILKTYLLLKGLSDILKTRQLLFMFRQGTNLHYYLFRKPRNMPIKV